MNSLKQIKALQEISQKNMIENLETLAELNQKTQQDDIAITKILRNAIHNKELSVVMMAGMLIHHWPEDLQPAAIAKDLLQQACNRKSLKKFCANLHAFRDRYFAEHGITYQIDTIHALAIDKIKELANIEHKTLTPKQLAYSMLIFADALTSSATLSLASTVDLKQAFIQLHSTGEATTKKKSKVNYYQQAKTTEKHPLKKQPICKQLPKVNQETIQQLITELDRPESPEPQPIENKSMEQLFTEFEALYQISTTPGPLK